MLSDDPRFSLTELLSLIGLAQAVSVLVYMAFRAGDRRAALLAFIYFFFLGAAFFLDFAARPLGLDTPAYRLAQWFFWFSGPPLSVLLILQIARGGRLPFAAEWGILLTIPAALACAAALSSAAGDCEAGRACHSFQDWLSVTGLMGGLSAMTVLWLRRSLIAAMAAQKGGSDRYWVVLTLVIVNLFFLGLSLVTGLSGAPSREGLVRSAVGLALAYLAGTSLFRIYPQTIVLKDIGPLRPQAALTLSEQAAAARITELMEIQKVYQEPAYSRSDMARELNMSEAVVSRIVNVTYGRTFPQLLNEKRVGDARRLLTETDAPVNVVAQEAGFNSLATFNRVFKDIAGENPTSFRESARRSGGQGVAP